MDGVRHGAASAPAKLDGIIRAAVVEDDEPLRECLVSDLSSRGIETFGVPSAEALYRQMVVRPVDVVVLDLGLPGEDGYSVTRHLCQLGTVGIVVLTGRNDRRVLERALRNGADMFLAKPVDFDALAAAVVNVRARFARHESPDGDAGASSPWSLRQDGWTLCAPDGSEFALSTAERAFLSMLFARPGEPVARDALIRAMTDAPWDFNPHRLEVLVHRLRSRVAEVAGEALPVRAVRGVGYALMRGS